MDALYFPHLSLPASTWVNPALLYFDRLCVIAPQGNHPRLFDRRTRELFDLGLARPLAPNFWQGDADERFVAYLLEQAALKRPIKRFERIHLGKLAHGPIAEVLVNARLLTLVDDRWLEGPDWLMAQIMAYLALQISSHARSPLPLVTDELAAARIMTGRPDRSTVSRRVRAVTRLLPAPADAPPTEIGRFRRQHSAELEAFRAYVDRLITTDPMSEDGESAFGERLRDAESIRDQLIGEMRGFNWRADAPSIGIAAAGAAASLLDHGRWGFGVGLLTLLYGGSQALASRTRQRHAARSPLIYATHVVSHWQPTAEQTLA